MSDAPDADAAPAAPPARPGLRDRRYPQQTFADRLFPGPSPRMSKQLSDRIEGLLRPLDGDTAVQTGRAAGSRSSATEDDARRVRPGQDPRSVAAQPELGPVREALEAQNELLRAILASTVETQNDARATAQNSRTFAWAGTAIALLTLLATVVSVIAAIQAG